MRNIEEEEKILEEETKKLINIYINNPNIVKWRRSNSKKKLII